MPLLFAALMSWSAIASPVLTEPNNCESIINPESISALAAQALEKAIKQPWFSERYARIVDLEAGRLLYRWSKNLNEKGEIKNPEADIEIFAVRTAMHAFTGSNFSDQDTELMAAALGSYPTQNQSVEELRWHLESRIKFQLLFLNRDIVEDKVLLLDLVDIQNDLDLQFDWPLEQMFNILAVAREMKSSPLMMALVEIARNPDWQIYISRDRPDLAELFAKEVLHQYPPGIIDDVKLYGADRDDLSLCPVGTGKAVCALREMTLIDLKTVLLKLTSKWDVFGPLDLAEPRDIKLRKRAPAIDPAATAE